MRKIEKDENKKEDASPKSGKDRYGMGNCV
jgi:hypothetical protein